MRSPLFILGPTGSGKSSLALSVARRSGSVILCMDSMQIYRGMDIGTSKPTGEELKEVSHKGLDLVTPEQSFDVAGYLSYVETLFSEMSPSSPSLIIVGGTGLYFRSLTQGICKAPKDASLREKLSSLPLPELQQRLLRIDSQMADTLDMKNPRRVIRAIEVMETSGISLVQWQKQTPQPLISSYRAYFISRPLEDLHARIQERTSRMFEEGWLEEVKQLIDLYGEKIILASAAIGYSYLASSLIEKTFDQKVALEKINIETRQYAKRQLTWFKREENLTYLKTPNNEELSETILSNLL